MKRQTIAYLLLAVAFKALLIAARPVVAADSASVDKWGYNLSFYLWLPSIDGTLGYNISGPGAGQQVDASSLLEDIQTVLMGNIEAHKSKWSFQADLIYLDMADEKQDSVNVNIGSGVDISTGAKTSLTGWYVGLSGAYRLHGSDSSTLYVLLGTRYLALDTEIGLNISGPLPPTLPGLQLNASTEILDAVVGVKGRLFLGSRWYMPYHLDVGTGTSQLTWQAMAGVGCQFKHWDLLLVYRHLGFDEGSDELLQSLTLSGPVLGFAVKF